MTRNLSFFEKLRGDKLFPTVKRKVKRHKFQYPAQQYYGGYCEKCGRSNYDPIHIR